MKTPKIKGYSYKQRTNTDYVRVVAEIPVADAKRLDDWGISQGMHCRYTASNQEYSGNKKGIGTPASKTRCLKRSVKETDL